MKHYILNTVLLVLVWVFSSSVFNPKLTTGKMRVADRDTPAVQAINITVVNNESGYSYNQNQASRGSQIFRSRCIFCHKLTKERLVGPGLKGVTNRKSDSWILNTLTHLDKMVGTDLDDMPLFMTDCAVKAQGKNLTNEQAKAVLEFIKKNDSKN